MYFYSVKSATKSDDAIVEDILTPVIEEPLSEEECDEAHILPAIPTSRCIIKGISDFRLFLQAHSKDTNNMQHYSWLNNKLT